jgi:hypothetical protein
LLALLVRFQAPTSAAAAIASYGSRVADRGQAIVAAATAPVRQAGRSAEICGSSQNAIAQVEPPNTRTGVFLPGFTPDVEVSANFPRGEWIVERRTDASRLAPAERLILPVERQETAEPGDAESHAAGQWPSPICTPDGNTPHEVQRQQIRIHPRNVPQQCGQQNSPPIPQTQAPPQAPAGQAPPVPLPITNNDFQSADWFPLPINQWDQTTWINVLPQQEEFQAPVPQDFNPPQADPPPAANPDCPDDDGAQTLMQVVDDGINKQVQTAPDTAADQF